MFDLGGTELLLIGIVALVVVGPKELPTMFRAVGMLTGRAREMAREFTSAMNSAADQSGLQEINKTIKAATNPTNFGMSKLKQAAGVNPPPMPAAVKTATPAAAPIPAAPIPAAGTPITPGDGAATMTVTAEPATAAPVIKPGGETEQLAAKLAAIKVRNAEAATARKAAKEAAAAMPAPTTEALPAVADPVVSTKKPAKPRTKKPLPAPPAADEIQ